MRDVPFVVHWAKHVNLKFAMPRWTGAVMRAAAVINVFAALLLACGGGDDTPTETGQALADKLLAQGDTFVLAQLDTQTTAPFALWDAVCSGVRIREEIADTLFLQAGGTFNRGYHVITILQRNPDPPDTSFYSWEPRGTFFGNAATVSLAYKRPDGSGGVADYRVRGEDLVHPELIGGSCSLINPTLPRRVDAVYRAR